MKEMFIDLALWSHEHRVSWWALALFLVIMTRISDIIAKHWLSHFSIAFVLGIGAIAYTSDNFSLGIFHGFISLVIIPFLVFSLFVIDKSNKNREKEFDNLFRIATRLGDRELLNWIRRNE